MNPAIFPGREAKPPMRMHRAQSLFLMRREIDDEEAAARPQGARGLANSAQGIVEIMQDLMHDDEIIEIRLDRHCVNIALAQLHIAQTGVVRCASRATLSICGD